MGICKQGTARILQGLKNGQTANCLCGDGGFPPFWPLIIHHDDLIVHRPFRCVAKVLGNLASAFVEVVTNLCVGKVGLNTSDGLFEVIGAIEGLPPVIDEISELTEIGIITEGPPSCVMYVDFGIFPVDQGFPGVSLLFLRCLGWSLGLRDVSVQAIVC